MPSVRVRDGEQWHSQCKRPFLPFVQLTFVITKLEITNFIHEECLKRRVKERNILEPPQSWWQLLFVDQKSSKQEAEDDGTGSWDQRSPDA